MVEMVECLLNGEYKIILPKHRADREQWYSKEGWERERLKAMHDKIRKHLYEKKVPPVVFYIGSEEGDMAALCQMWGAELVLFEPNPKVWSNTKAIWEANKLSTPICIQGFASDKDTRYNWNKFIYAHEWPEDANREIEAAHGFKELNKEADSYPQVEISQIVGTDNIGYPDFVCIDVEGAEGHVLRGMESLMNSHRKPTIFLSLHPEFLRDYGEWGAELRRWIIDCGYKETLLDYPLHEVHLMYEAE